MKCVALLSSYKLGEWVRDGRQCKQNERVTFDGGHRHEYPAQVGPSLS